jgi:membrane fusion protein, copper/silver efflux system
VEVKVKAFYALFSVAVLFTLASSARAADTINGVLTPYFRIQSALVDDRIDTLKNDALLVAQEASSLGAAGKPIEEAATVLSQATEIGAAREAFGRLSDAVIAYADSTKINPGPDVVTMYCPMVKKSWLQKNGEVKNPYFGKAMPNCGEKKKVG